MKIFKSIPVLTFGRESWILNARGRSKIQAVEMNYLRKIGGISMKGRVRNVDVRRDLSLQPTLDFVKQRK